MTRDRAERVGWIAGGVGLAGAALGWLLTPQVFPHAWLAALSAWLGWPLGCMGLLLIHALTGGRWGDAIRVPLVAGMATLPLLLPAVVPLGFVLPALYPWAHSGVAENLHNRFYLNLPFFAGRAAVYLVIWLGLAALIYRALGSDRAESRLARLAPAGLILLAITVTYAAIDLTMSLDPRFSSSVYGMIAIAECGLLALSVSLLLATLAMPINGDAVRSLGRLLLGLLVLWAYLDFMQLLIVWQSDLPNEAPWYLARISGDWGIIAALVAAMHFVLPFFALLSPRVQRSRHWIGGIAGLLVLGAIVRAWWLVLPAGARGPGWTDAAATIGLIGVAAALALRAALQPALGATTRSHG